MDKNVRNLLIQIGIQVAISVGEQTLPPAYVGYLHAGKKVCRIVKLIQNCSTLISPGLNADETRQMVHEIRMQIPAYQGIYAAKRTQALESIYEILINFNNDNAPTKLQNTLTSVRNFDLRPIIPKNDLNLRVILKQVLNKEANPDKLIECVLAKQQARLLANDRLANVVHRFICTKASLDGEIL